MRELGGGWLLGGIAPWPAYVARHISDLAGDREHMPAVVGLDVGATADLPLLHDTNLLLYARRYRRLTKSDIVSCKVAAHDSIARGAARDPARFRNACTEPALVPTCERGADGVLRHAIRCSAVARHMKAYAGARAGV